MFKTIVVGIDGSDASKTALRVACDIATKYSSELHLVHTPQPQTVAFAAGAIAGYHATTVMPPDDDVKDAAEKIVRSGMEIARECGQSIARTNINRGHPVDQLIGHAEKFGADLIVTGRRGLGNFSALVLGSTSQGVCHGAKCAVLSVA